MYELFILALLVTVVVLSLRRGKPVAIDHPLVIQRPGQYHITLAPQLEGAQAFIEWIAAQFALLHPPQGELPSAYFSVPDPSVSAQEGGFYLLAAAYRGGVLYFQAIIPQPLLRDADSHLKQIREFSEAVLALHPLKHPAGAGDAEKLCRAVEMAALQSNRVVKILSEPD